MTRGRRNGQAKTANPFAPRIRAAARATGVASVFTLAALAGFGTEPTATRPAQIAADFMPRPYAMSYAVREAVAQARAERQFAGVVEVLEARPEPVAVPVVAYRAADRSDALDRFEALDRFDAFVGGTLALDTSDMPTPTMRPIMQPVGPDASRP